MLYETKPDRRLAVLIDADNASRNALKDVMTEVATYGTPTLKRIYGDWTSPNMGSWKAKLLEHAITPIQQYSYTTGKNSTDSAMIIDAMDILYSGHCDGFVLVSSDSDFTRLATRLREAGMKVYGIGERKTPQPFIVACDKFVYIEVIRAEAQKASLEQRTPEPAKNTNRPTTIPHPTPSKPVHSPGKAISQADLEFIANSVEGVCDEDGTALLSRLGDLMLKNRPDFDPRNYGYPKLHKLLESHPRFKISKQGTLYFVTDTQSK